MARTGMANLIATWRRMVDDTGTAIWTADQAQEILDQHRYELWGEMLTSVPVYQDNDTVWKVYTASRGHLESTTGGTAIFRVYASDGTAVGTANYTPNYEIGVVEFGADQGGTTYYLDARAYDLNAAAVDGWVERMGKVSGYYSFAGDGQRYDRSDYFDHCKAMAEFYRAESPMSITHMVRSDLA